MRTSAGLVIWAIAASALAGPTLASEPGPSHGTLGSALKQNEVEITPYGDSENIPAYRSAAFIGIRFDPPFDPPYKIARVRFPSFTMNGVPAVFPSVSLVQANALGRIDGTPLFRIAPFIASADGVNDVLIDLNVTEPDKTFYWCVEFPSSQTATFPNDYPFMKMDYLDMDRGFFASTFSVVPLPGTLPVLIADRNVVTSMICELASPDAIPIQPGKNLGGNRIRSDTNRLGQLVFSFTPASDVQMDGTPMRKNSLARSDLLYRAFPHAPWRVFASGGPHSDRIVTDPTSGGLASWAIRSVDRNGHASVTSNVVQTINFLPGVPTQTADDAYEPNGRRQDATSVQPNSGPLYATCFPAGDEDYYTFEARPGDQVAILVGRSGTDKANDLLPVVQLFDKRGRVVATAVARGDAPIPPINYDVPSGIGRSTDPQRFTILIRDVQGSSESPDTAPRVIVPFPAYVLTVLVEATSPASSERVADARPALGTHFGPNPGQAGAWFSLAQSGGVSTVKLRIFDVHGRLIRALEQPGEQSGSRALYWDSKDEAGRLVPSGQYFGLLDDGRSRLRQRVTIIR